MKRITSVSLPGAALVVAFLAGDAVLGLPTQVEARSYGDVYGNGLYWAAGGVELWQGDANDLDGLAGTGLESINDESRRWSIPIIGGITVRF